MIKYSINHGGSNIDFETLGCLIKSKKYDIIKLLLQNNVNLNIGYTLRKASRHNQYELVELIVNAKVDARSINEAFVKSCIRNHIEITRLLIKAGANVNYDYSRVTHLLINNNQIEMIKLLIANGLNEVSKIDLLDKAQAGDFKLIELFVNCNFDDTYRKSLITSMTEYGRLDLLKLIVKDNKMNHDIASAAIKFCHIDIIKEYVMNEYKEEYISLAKKYNRPYLLQYFD